MSELEVVDRQPAEMRAAFNKALLAAQQEFPPIHKGRTANIKTKDGSYSYKYADFGDVLEAVLPILHKHGIALSQPPIWAPGQVGVQTKLIHESGWVEECGELMLPAGNNPQAAGSSLTYCRRYAACAALGIVADEDDDGRSASVPESDYVEAPDFTEEILAAVAEFTEWDDDKKRAEWIRATAEVGNGRPKTLEDVNTIAKQVREFYAEYLDKLTGDES